MAASGLDHLKNDYRRRFCRASRTPNINTKQGQNILEILQDCFEEKSLADDYCTNSTKSVLCSTPKIKDMSIQSPSKEAQCQKSHPKSVPVSSRKKEASLQFTVEPCEAIDKSVQAHEVHQKVLATDVGSKNTPDSGRMSNKKLKYHPEAEDDFYLSVGSPSVLLDAKTAASQNAIPSIVQKRETYALENPVNTLSSITETALKTRKRLNFEDKDVSKKSEIASKVEEIEDKVSEGPQEKKLSRTSHKRVQDSEYDIQPQSKKSFSTLFLETVKRKSESRHIATAPLHSSPVNDMKLLEDEFVIDESDRSFASQSWLTVPRNAGSLKKRTVSPHESTALLQRKKSREKHHNILPTTLTSDKHSGKAYPVEKSHPSEQKKLGRSCALSDEMENNYRSTKYEMYSENAEKSSGNKRTIKQKQRRKFKATVVDKQVDTEQSKGKNRNMSPIIQDNLQRNSDKNTEQRKEMGNVRSSKKQVSPVGSKKSSINVPHEENLKRNSNCNKKHFSNESNNKLVTLEEVTLTVTRSQRISRRPSNWWVVKSEESPVDNNSFRRNELSLNRNSRQKPAEKTSQSSKNIRKKNVPLKGQKRTTPRSSRAHNFLKTSDSEGIIDHDEISGSQNESLEKDEADLAKKKNLDHPGVKKSKVTPESKIHHKLVLPSNTPNVRRTKRTRLKPLEYWRGERIDYQGRPSGGFVIGGILSPDTVSSKRKAKGNMGKVNKVVHRKRICLDNDQRKNKLVVNLNIPLGDPLKPTRAKDPETREIILMDLIMPRDTYQFFVEHGDLKVYKTLDTPFFSTGKLVLGPHQEKGKQHVGLDMLVFYVDFGDLLCTLHETSYIITTGDSFYVPSVLREQPASGALLKKAERCSQARPSVKAEQKKVTAVFKIRCRKEKGE
ncbi:hypothetical protein MC885_017521 [Smutsia gigantea]|nr:hypothetical protein MC885_017521 [Smutsia gigantea]